MEFHQELDTLGGKDFELVCTSAKRKTAKSNPKDTCAHKRKNWKGICILRVLEKNNVGIALKLTESHISLILHSHYNATDPLFLLLC